jgi:hypothetical protein
LRSRRYNDIHILTDEVACNFPNEIVAFGGKRSAVDCYILADIVPSRSPFSNACQVVVLSVQSKTKKATRGIFLGRWASDACGMEHIPSVIARKIAANLVLITIAPFSFVTFCAETVCSDTETGRRFAGCHQTSTST